MITSTHFEARRRERGLRDATLDLLLRYATLFIGPDGTKYLTLDHRTPCVTITTAAGWILVLDTANVGVTCYRRRDPVYYLVAAKQARTAGRRTRS